jgi:hypothetical protein
LPPSKIRRDRNITTLEARQISEPQGRAIASQHQPLADFGQCADPRSLAGKRLFDSGTALAMPVSKSRGKSRGDGNKRDSTMEQNRMKIAYVITQRNSKNFWNRVGVAFVNNDGSINVKLEAVPVSGEIQIRDYVPRDELASTNGRTHSRETVEEEPYAELA